MRKIIPNPAEPERPGYVVESHEATDAVMLEADGVTHWFAPDVARRIGKALLQAASLAEYKLRSPDGGGSAPDDDLPDLY